MMSSLAGTGHMPSIRKRLRPLVLVGAPGVGKTTLMNKLSEKHPDIYHTAVMHLTREMKEGEEEGVDGYFVSMENFKAMI